MEIYDYLNYQPQQVDILAQLGVLNIRQNKFYEAIYWLGKASNVAEKNSLQVGILILIDLAHILKTIGEKEFNIAWKHSFKNQNPPEIIRMISDKI